MSYTVDSRRAGSGTFANIFSLEQNAEKANHQTSIARQLDLVTNYNSMDSNYHHHTRTSSMETVWVHDDDVAVDANNTSKDCSPKLPENVTNFGIPSMLQTTHMEIEYDPRAFGNADKPTSFWNTAIHLFITSAGPAVLSIPIFFSRVGYGLGLFVTFVALYLYVYSMRSLLWCEYKVCKSKRVPHLPYADVIYFAFKDGPASFRWFAGFGRCTIRVVFIMMWASGCCYNLTLSVENVQIVYNRWTHRNIDGHVIMSWMVIPLLFLCWVRRLKYLVPVSITASIANALCVGIVTYDVIFSEENFRGASAVGSVTQLPVFLGTIFFTVTATGLVLPLKKEMKDPRRFNSVLIVTYVPVYFMYSIFGLICALKYGSNLKETVTQNVQQGHLLTQYMILANAVTLILQYPILAYVIFDVIWNGMMGELKRTGTYLVLWEYLLRTAITIVVFLVSYMLPSVELFLTLGGAIGTMIDSLLFPALMRIVLTWKESKNKRTFYRCVCKNLVITLLAIVLIISGSVSCLYSILGYYGFSQKST